MKESIAALSLVVVSLSAATAQADDREPPGWGMAIAARVIGEKCAGALEAGEITDLNAFIAAQYSKSVETSGKGVAWWADLRDKLEQTYVEKYSDPANCTDEARDQAEDLVEDVKEYGKD